MAQQHLALTSNGSDACETHRNPPEQQQPQSTVAMQRAQDQVVGPQSHASPTTAAEAAASLVPANEISANSAAQSLTLQPAVLGTASVHVQSCTAAPASLASADDASTAPRSADDALQDEPCPEEQGPHSQASAQPIPDDSPQLPLVGPMTLTLLAHEGGVSAEEADVGVHGPIEEPDHTVSHVPLEALQVQPAAGLADIDASLAAALPPAPALGPAQLTGAGQLESQRLAVECQIPCQKKRKKQKKFGQGLGCLVSLPAGSSNHTDVPADMPDDANAIALGMQTWQSRSGVGAPAQDQVRMNCCGAQVHHTEGKSLKSKRKGKKRSFASLMKKSA